MSDNTKFKKAVRARMARTGETYSTARMHLLASLVGSEPATPPPPSGIRGQIQTALDAHPDLSYFGFRTWLVPIGGDRAVAVAAEAAEFAEKRAHILTDDGVQQVEKCLAYLALVRKTRTAKPKGDSYYPSSYGLKHEVEAWLGVAGKDERDKYIGNGAFIVAAVVAGFPIHRGESRSPNCAVGVDREDVRAVREGKDPREWRKTTAFVKWLFSQAGRGDPVGDLAGDCKADFKFPRQGNVAEIRSYLARYGDHIHEAFDNARAEYRALA